MPNIMPISENENKELLDFALCLKQTNDDVHFEIKHTLYNGVYYRTAKIPAGAIIVGANIIIPTVLIISGQGKTNINGEVVDFEGYNVFECLPNRRQIVHAISDVYLTMCFKTEAQTVKEAEKEFTNEYNLLM